jgi:biopolymer transport protein ExbB
MFELVDSILAFIDKGGQVLWLIFILSFALWFMIAERYIYLKRYARDESKALINEYHSYPNQGTWQNTTIKEQLVNSYKASLNQSLSIIKTLVVIAPFLGLLGTVTGMIEIFDIMAVTGSSDAKAMASGVSKATIPTLSGMVVSISGIFLISRYESAVKLEMTKIKEAMSC